VIIAARAHQPHGEMLKVRRLYLCIAVETFDGLVASHPSAQGRHSLRLIHRGLDGVVEDSLALLDDIGRATIFAIDKLGTLFNGQRRTALAAKDLDWGRNSIHVEILALNALTVISLYDTLPGCLRGSKPGDKQ
jgi:hypothetical protein